jgi:hypothetical protein
MCKKLVTKVSAAPLVLSLALTIIAVILAACSTDTNNNSNEPLPRSSSSRVTYRPSSVATNLEVVVSSDLNVSLSGTQRNQLSVVLQVRGNDTNDVVVEKGLAVTIKLNGNNVNNSDLGCGGKVSYQCDGIIPITAGLCGVFTVCYEVRLAGSSNIEAQDCKDLTRDESYCAPSSSSVQSSSSADNRRLVQNGGDISLNTATTNTCINLSSAQAGNSGDVCLEAASFAAKGSSSITVQFRDEYGYATKQTRFFPTSSVSSLEDFIFRSHPDAWFKSQEFLADQYYAICTDGGPKADWTENCYLMLPTGIIMSEGSIITVKVWKVQ